MAVAYRLDFDAPHGVMKRETMSIEEWEAKYAKCASLTFIDDDGNYHDVTEWVSELQIVHNELDADGSGRDVKTGAMKRTLIATKHTLNIKIMDRCPQSIAHYIFALVDSNSNRVSFQAVYQWPCGNRLATSRFYCSTVNFGAQRYDKSDNYCYYTGMNFNIIQM